MLASPRTLAGALLATLLIASVAPVSTWADDEIDPLVERGIWLLMSKSCLNCHTTDGRRRVGTTFLGYFGSEVTVSVGGEERLVRVDAEHVRRSLRHPNVEARIGYTDVMPEVDISDAELDAIVAALKHLSTPEQVESFGSSPLGFVLAVLAFIVGHLFLSSTTVHTRLTRKLGSRGFVGIYSVFAAGTLTWVVWAYIVAP